MKAILLACLLCGADPAATAATAIEATGATGAGAPEAAVGRVGDTIAPFELQDFRGRRWSLGEFEEKPVLVVAFLGVECPLVKQYAARLVEFEARYRDRGVAFLGIDSNQQDSLAAMAHLARTQKIEFPLLKDGGNVVADLFAAERTPEVFVLDRRRRIAYRGAIDDQYSYGKQRNEPENHYLRDALDALLADREPPLPRTEALGCLIGRKREPVPGAEVTYSRHIAPILNGRCVSCHRPGEIGPFSLRNYKEVVGWAEMIEEVTRLRRMPPWHADPRYGHFANENRLSEEELGLIARWVEAGSPEGDPAELPAPPEFTEGWQIEEPELVIPMARRPFSVPARGEVRYQYFVVDPGFTEDKWVRQAEARPGNRSVVHHIIVAVRPPEGEGGSHGLASDWLVATAPGARPLVLPEGMAKRIPAGSKLIFQMHYTPNGTAQDDLSSVGLVFADPETVEREVVTQKAANNRFKIPPGAPAHPVSSRHVFAHDSLLLALFPHMHLRGKAFRYTMRYPDGREEILLNIPEYDFNWQNGYEFADPKPAPAGSVLLCDALFDNSERNLANPDPTAEVGWGDQTWEEMMIGYFDMALADQDLRQAVRRARTEEFLARPARAEDSLPPRIREACAGALDSEAAWLALGLALREEIPQLDRLCLTVMVDGKLRVERAAQPAELAKFLGGAGVSVPQLGLALPRYAAGSEPVVHERLAAARGGDLRHMSRGLASSLHLPVKAAVGPATLNAWSKEQDAFPPAAVRWFELLAEELFPREADSASAPR